MAQLDRMSVRELRLMANRVRGHVVETIYRAGSGHPGGSLSATDIITSLYFNIMRHDPENPRWEDRDRFILSKGHAAPALYGALAEAGYFPVEELETLRKLGSKLQGHPDMRKTRGVEASTGSLGQGLPMACGFALAAKLDRKAYRIYALIGDGENQSGSIWEAAAFASHYKLDNLIVFLDRNQLQIDGPTERVMSLEPLGPRWESFGWHVMHINGHEVEEILEAVKEAHTVNGKPIIIICHTTKGKGVSFMEGALAFHGKAPNKEEHARAMEELAAERARLEGGEG